MTKTTFPLEKARVLVTRPAHQAEPLCRLLDAAGASVTRFPALAIEPLPDSSARTLALARLSEQRLLAFTSVNAVNGFRDLLANHGLPLPADIACAAIGQSTGHALQRMGMRDVTIAPPPHTSEALLAHPLMQRNTGGQSMIITGAGGRGLLAQRLQQQGDKVTVLEVYRRTLPQVDPEPFRKWLVEGQQFSSRSVIVVTSGEILDNLMLLAGDTARQPLLTSDLVTVSIRIRKIAWRRGFSGTITLSEPNDAAVAQSIVRWWHQTETQANR